MILRRLRLTPFIALLLLAAHVDAGTGSLKGTVTRGAVGTPVENAVVMVEGPSEAAGAPHAVMDQRKETFVPHVLAVAVGTTVDFWNHDPMLHNVASRSRAKPFDLGMYGEGESRSVLFDTPGVVGIRCEVHPRMSAVVLVHTNPFFAVTDGRGAYTITGVPAGHYQVRIWHEDLSEATVPATVHEGQVDTLDVRLQARR
jgi:plastocyanin